MKKAKFSRAFAVLLALVIVVGTIPLTALPASAATTSDGIAYEISNGEVTITDYTGSATKLDIPANIEGYPVTSIGNSAFYNCESIESIIIPDGITRFGEYSFRNCTSLTSIELSEGLTSIGYYAFDKCISLTSINLPNGLTNLGEGVFRGCSNLTSMTVPDGVTVINDSLFEECTGLESVTIPDGITSIGDLSFRRCTSLTSIDLPERLTSIGVQAFQECTSLSDIVIPDTVTRIDLIAFNACHSLKSIVIPEGNTYIADYLFYNCTSLESITIPESVTNIGSNSFYNAPVTIYGYKNSYAETYANENSIPFISIEDQILLESLEYSISDGEVTITGYTGSATVIDIPANIEGYPVTSIGNSAFYNCDSIISIELPESVKSIGDEIVSECDNLTSLTVDGNNTTYYSAGNCIITKADKVLVTGCKASVIPEEITSIGDRAFYECTSLTSIVIPDGVTSIGEFAFYGCESLTGIVIPEGVTSIGSGIVGNCDRLTSLTADSNNTTYYSEGNCIITKADKVLVIGCNVSVIPEGVISVGDYAFFYCESFTGITLPDSITSIGNYAFYFCTSLESIVIPDGVANIGEFAFYGCWMLMNITLPVSLTSIGDNAFEYCGNIMTVYYGASSEKWSEISIGSKNTLLTSATILFNYGTELEGIEYTVNTDTQTVTITKYSGDKSNLIIPAEIEGYPVTVIGYRAFYNCSNLTSIEIPEGVTTIGVQAFYKCYNLKSIEIPAGVTTIASETFSQCSNLASITLPEGITRIDNSAFYYCSDLTSVTFPDSIIRIDDSAFYNCYKLTSITLPEGVISIGHSAFYNCYKLTSISIPDGVINIEALAFYGTAYYDNSENWEDNFLYIGNYLIEASEEISSSCVVKNGTKVIADQAFKACSHLTSIVIPESVTAIGYSAFENCSLLNTVYYSGTKNEWSQISIYYYNDYLTKARIIWSYGTEYEGFDYVVNTETGTVTINGYSGTNTSIVIPSTINGYPVTNIWSGAFKGNTSITSVEISEGVTGIGYEAFYGCTSLTSIILPESLSGIGELAFYNTAYYNNSENWEGNVLYISNYLIKAKTSIKGSYVVKDGTTAIAARAFEDCTDLTSIVIPEGVTSIGGWAFAWCTGLESVTLPEGMTSIDARTFYSCSKLTSITLPEGITSIGSDAFGYCTRLKSIVIPDGVTSMADSVFYNCTGLTSVVIPEGVTSIGIWAFYNCTSLTSIVVPEGVTRIDNSAFYKCTSLKSITLPDTLTSVSPSAFYETAYYNNSKNWVDNVLYIGNYLINAKSGISSSYTVKDGTIAIAESALYSCTGLTDITIPQSVISIGDSAFVNCSKLVAVHYWGTGEQWSNITIGSNNSALTNIHSMDEMSITENAPTCTESGLREFYCSVCEEVLRQESIDATGHSEGTPVIIEPDCTNKGTRSYYCTECNILLRTETIKALGHTYGDPVIVDPTCTESGTNTYYCTVCEKLLRTETVKALGHTDGEPIIVEPTCTEKGTKTYYCTVCEELARVEDIPAAGHAPINGICSVCGIESGTNGLVFNVTDGEATVTDYNGSDTEVYIPSTYNGYPVTRLGEEAFSECRNMVSIWIPETITYIGAFCFDRCTALEKVNITDINAWLKIEFVYEQHHFYRYGYYEHSSPCYMSCPFSYCGEYSDHDYSTPSGHVYSNAKLYLNGELVTEIELSDEDSVISNYAFMGYDSLKKIIIKDGVKTLKIGTDALQNVSLDELYVPKSLETINGTIVASKVMYGGTNEQYEGLAENLTGEVVYNYGTTMEGFLITKNDVSKTIKITGYNGNKTEIVIPASFEGYTVTSISPTAFAGRTDITSISIPGGVKYIEEYSFANCTALESVKFNKGLLEICDYAFSGCVSLRSIVIPEGVDTIWGYAFNECSNISRVQLPSSLSLVEYKAFYRCESVRYVTYAGTEEEFSEITFMSGNNAILNADITYLNGEIIIVPGDYDGDGTVTAIDSNCLKRVIAGVLSIEVGSEQYLSSDVNGDGTVNAIDSNILKRIIAGAN